MKTRVTVVMPVRNSEKYVHECMRSLLDQTIKDFEILIDEDPPYDRTKEIVDAFGDERIRYFRNPKRLGRYRSRNICVKQARGEYIFFTDDDCIVSKDWIEQGLESFRNDECIAVEGRTYYVSDKYQPTFSDHVVKSNGGDFMTCNVAYRKSVFESVGGFDERYQYLGDRDFGLRAMKVGKIHFNPKMIVYHQKVTLTPKEFIHGEAQRAKSRVLLYKKFRERKFFRWRIAFPLHLLAIICPPLVFGSLLRNSYKSKEDYALFPFIYIRLIYERLNLWNSAIRERVFLI